MAIMSTSVDVKDLAIQWTTVLESVRSGEEVLIVDRTVPQARILPIVRRHTGMHPNAMELQPDFDEALPESFWAAAQ